MFIAMKEDVTQCNGVAHECVFENSAQQQRSMAHRNKIYQALASGTTC